MIRVLLLIVTMAFNINPYLNANHSDIFKYTGEELLVYGGAGAGKSYSISDKLLLQSMFQPDKDIKVLCIRKTFPALRATVVDILEKRAKVLRLPWVLNKADWVAKCNNVKFEFQSLNNKDDFEKLKSRTDIDFIWINELTELREADYEECLRRMRGGESMYQQIIADFNPIDSFSWVNSRFFTKNIGNVKKLRYTVADNHPSFIKSPKGKKYIARLDAMAASNPNAYNIYRLGKWGVLEGVIFENWDLQEVPTDRRLEVWYGGDFGFTVDPAALVKIHYADGEAWLEECIYETGLTNQALASRMQGHPDIDIKAESYWDSSEPKSIEELYQAGINVHPASKGADSIRAGIDFMLELKLHIVPGSENLIKEFRSYCWATDKNGNATNKPVDFNNHLIDGSRYGLWTRLKARVVPRARWL